MIQYYHGNLYSKKYTVAVAVVHKDMFVELLDLNSNRTIFLDIGVSLVHPNDHYVKKTGRDVSSKKLLHCECILDYINYEDDAAYLTLNVSHPDLHHIQIRLYPNAVKAHLVYALLDHKYYFLKT